MRAARRAPRRICPSRRRAQRRVLPASSRRTENASYQPSRTVKHTDLSQRNDPPDFDGRARSTRLFAGTASAPKQKESLVPPSAEVLKGVHDIVAGITGYTEPRGDQIRSKRFPSKPPSRPSRPWLPPPPAKQAPAGFDFKQPIVIGGAVLLVLLVGGARLSSCRASGAGTRRRHGADGHRRRAVRAPAALDGKPAADRDMERQIAENDAAAGAARSPKT